jgi:hypothetical protein
VTIDSTVQGPAEPAPCEWCGLLHAGPPDAPRLCPYVKALEYRCDEAGTRYVSRVEFLTPVDYQPIKSPPAADRSAEPEYPKAQAKVY